MTFDGSKLSGTAPYAAEGTYDIQILASDGQLQNADVFKVSFVPGNAAPVAEADGPFNVYHPQAVEIQLAAILANDTDPDGDPLTVTAVAQPENGSVLLSNGAITYAAKTGYSGADQFVYTVSDGKNTANGIVRLNVDSTYASYQQGTAGDDFNFGGFAKSSYFAGAGDDAVIASLVGGEYAGGQGNDSLIAVFGASRLDGNEGDDRIMGGTGDDTISGGTGNDLLIGGAGLDIFIYRDGDGSDLIKDFQTGGRIRRILVGSDAMQIDVTGIGEFEDLMAFAHQTETGVLFDFGSGDDLFLAGTRLAALDKDSFSFV
jgi:Ca2+-binding RTX toxin-like protein